MPRAIVVIPARWGSTRFPGKVLAPLHGRALVLHAWDIARAAASIADVVVATDDDRVRAAAEEAGATVALTDAALASGTDRVAAVARGLEAEIVLGLQADEPFLAPDDLDHLVGALATPDGEPADLATLAVPIEDRREWLDPNAVKVVTDRDDRALYFSRSAIPYRRAADGSMPPLPDGAPPAEARLHVGVYAWRREALLAFADLLRSPLEIAEGLEQLRALEAGWRVRVLPARGRPFGIDTPGDLARAEALPPARTPRGGTG
jgi:3-deoxy-manno-octulosonate cytidylyltransferase (CMP-KDO synthetase)